MDKKYTIEGMRRIAKKHKGKCLSTKYIDVKTKLQWQCENGHIWWTTPHNTLGGHWCPECIGLKKLNIEFIRKNAEKRGGECISGEYINCKTKLEWRCGEGHTWWATPNNILRGHWCPYCAGLKKLSIETIQELGKKRGGECLSTEYINNRTKLEWRCGDGHTWWANSNNISNGKWCPQCAKNKRGEVFSQRRKKKNEVSM